MTETVTVACSVVNGISLRLTRPGEDDGTGYRPPRLSGLDVRLMGPSARGAGTNNGFRAAPGRAVMNEDIDVEFMKEWLEQNRLNPLVMGGSIFVVEK